MEGCVEMNQFTTEQIPAFSGARIRDRCVSSQAIALLGLIKTFVLKQSTRIIIHESAPLQIADNAKL